MILLLPLLGLLQHLQELNYKNQKINRQIKKYKINNKIHKKP